MDNFEPNSARELINRFIRTIGARDETGVVPFVQAWPKIVGQDKAAHSQVLDVKNGTVLIGVDHPAWLQRMHMDRTRIVARIQGDFPSLNARNLAFTIVSELSNPWQGDTGGTSAVEHPPEETPEASAAEVASSAAEDHEFQQRLNRLKKALEEKEQVDEHQSD
ncbi:MAG: DUF721 domain-containing protein [Alkalispirochaeta sp.]